MPRCDMFGVQIALCNGVPFTLEAFLKLILLGEGEKVMTCSI